MQRAQHGCGLAGCIGASDLLAHEACPLARPDFVSGIFDAMESLVFVVDETGTIVWVNRAYAKITGFGVEEAVGRFFWDVHYPSQNAEQARRAYDEFGARTPKVLSGILGGHIVTKDGERRILSWSNTVIEQDGRIYAVATGVDVTEWKSMQMRVLLADRMASVGTLAAGVAHEINNPLAYIQANLSMANDCVDAIHLRRPEHDLLEVKQMLGEATEGANRVQRIVGDLKTFSRVDEGRRLGSHDLHHIIETSIKMARNELRHRAQLIKDYGDVPQIECSETRLGQVFVNLLVNAAHAIPEGAAARNEVRIVTRRKAGYVVVEVHDSGVGMSEETLAQIFDPFFTTKPVGEGTGLGLSICHSVVTAIGGDISAESREGEGSVFRVTIPASGSSVAPDPHRPSVAPPANSTPVRVLVVDDERMVANSLRRALRSHDVVTASSGREALDVLARDTAFSVVLCDLMMPDLTGMDVYAEVKKRFPGLETRMVFVTGGAFTTRAQDFLRDVPNRHILKPFDVTAVRALVSEFAAAS